MAIRANAIRIYGNAKRMYEEGVRYCSETLDSELAMPMYVAFEYANIIRETLPEAFCHKGFEVSYLGDANTGSLNTYFVSPYDTNIVLPAVDEFVAAINHLDINNLSTTVLNFARGRSLVHLGKSRVNHYKQCLLNPFGGSNWSASSSVEPPQQEQGISA